MSKTTRLTFAISIVEHPQSIIIREDTYPKPREIFLMKHDIAALANFLKDK